MPSFDWMKDEKFKDEIKNTVSQTAGRSGMDQYRTSIVNLLMGNLEKNRDARILTESAKISTEQRSKNDALRSVEVLITEACEIAKADNRKLVTESDFESAYQAKFCTVWPFC